MKVIAISRMGAKRDFVDLYFVLQKISFWKIAENMTTRFGRESVNPMHIGKSFLFFDDANADPGSGYSGKEKPDWVKIKHFLYQKPPADGSGHREG